MKKLFCFLLALVFTIGATGCSPSKKKLIVGLDDKFPPMGFRDESGALVGFDIDMAKAAGEKMGMEMEFQPINWSSKELELSSKKVDLLWNGYTITEERKKLVHFSDPYLLNRQVIMVDAASGVSSKADLNGHSVGVQKDSSAVDAINSDPATASTFKEMVEYEDNIMAFQDLAIGRTAAVVVDEIVAKYYLAKNDTNFVLLEEDFGDEEYGVGVRLEDNDLYDKLQKALNEMKEDGTAAEISSKWFGEDIVVK